MSLGHPQPGPHPHLWARPGGPTCRAAKREGGLLPQQPKGVPWHLKGESVTCEWWSSALTARREDSQMINQTLGNAVSGLQSSGGGREEPFMSVPTSTF